MLVKPWSAEGLSGHLAQFSFTLGIQINSIPNRGVSHPVLESVQTKESASGLCRVTCIFALAKDVLCYGDHNFLCQIKAIAQFFLNQLAGQDKGTSPCSHLASRSNDNAESF